MSYESVFTHMNEAYYQLTVTEKRVAEYITQQREKIQFMSISELAEECSVAEATISRFCKHLGYQGYNALKLAIANATATEPVVQLLTKEVTAEDSITDLCEKLAYANAKAITETKKLVDTESIGLAADFLGAAKTIFCLGQGASMILAQQTAHLFSTTFAGVYAIWDSHAQALTVTHLLENDVALFFSYSGATREIVEMMNLVKKNRAKVILITRFPKSPGGELADIVLQCAAKETALQFASVSASMAQLYLVDILFHELSRRDVKNTAIVRQKVAEALSEKHL